ncbi:O-antigen translocase [Ulvibacter antarcticus]|uniref:PST family polysaccharide transporter n=1 Tax=Ulvibacter antarcticus TaxID=442714 RepID=A0A3L9Y7P8_9FLAO|nr:O-antigen translocase [Ulvibacter antarcticus]RMA56736.1 PST family polysaccharide transporter [Ulvibacter antarcticus]
MKIPEFIRANLLLKVTSLNAVVISIRLFISIFVQRLIAELVGEAGVSKIGQLRNLTELLTSFSSLGVFTGVVKYVSEHKSDKEQLQKLFSTVFVMSLLGIVITSLVLFFGANYISEYLFVTTEYAYLIKLLAVIVPFISLYRIFNGVVNGLSMYKKFAKIDIFAYLASAGLLVYSLLEYNIDGALVAIAITPIIQFIVLMIIFFKVLKEYIQFSKLSFKTPMLNVLLAFSLMSFFSTVLLNFVDIEIRSMIIDKITEADAGIWTAMTNISKNYMVFSSSIFTLYVLPKFAGIYSKSEFKTEVFSIYKTLLPIFGLGMIAVYFGREYIIQLIYPGFDSMSPLFKWQLLGDFVRLATIVIGYQFLAKKLVRSFIFSEIVSIGLFYIFAYYLTNEYGVEGVVMAHFFRYVICFFLIFYLVIRYFKKQSKLQVEDLNPEDDE